MELQGSDDVILQATREEAGKILVGALLIHHPGEGLFVPGEIPYGVQIMRQWTWIFRYLLSVISVISLHGTMR